VGPGRSGRLLPILSHRRLVAAPGKARRQLLRGPINPPFVRRCGSCKIDGARDVAAMICFSRERSGDFCVRRRMESLPQGEGWGCLGYYPRKKVSMIGMRLRHGRLRLFGIGVGALMASMAISGTASRSPTRAILLARLGL
jgi:hypothetical protein